MSNESYVHRISVIYEEDVSDKMISEVGEGSEMTFFNVEDVHDYYENFGSDLMNNLYDGVEKNLSDLFDEGYYSINSEEKYIDPKGSGIDFIRDSFTRLFGVEGHKSGFIEDEIKNIDINENLVGDEVREKSYGEGLNVDEVRFNFYETRVDSFLEDRINSKLYDIRSSNIRTSDRHDISNE